MFDPLEHVPLPPVRVLCCAEVNTRTAYPSMLWLVCVGLGEAV